MFGNTYLSSSLLIIKLTSREQVRFYLMQLQRLRKRWLKTIIKMHLCLANLTFKRKQHKKYLNRIELMLEDVVNLRLITQSQ